MFISNYLRTRRSQATFCASKLHKDSVEYCHHCRYDCLPMSLAVCDVSAAGKMKPLLLCIVTNSIQMNIASNNSKSNKSNCQNNVICSFAYWGLYAVSFAWSLVVVYVAARELEERWGPRDAIRKIRRSLRFIWAALGVNYNIIYFNIFLAFPLMVYKKVATFGFEENRKQSDRQSFAKNKKVVY